MADELFGGRHLRILTIVDNPNRVSPPIGVRFSYKGYDVVLALNLAVEQYGVQERIQMDNGPGFVSKEVDLWSYARVVVWISPGRGSPRTIFSWNRTTAVFGRSARMSTGSDP